METSTAVAASDLTLNFDVSNAATSKGNTSFTPKQDGDALCKEAEETRDAAVTVPPGAAGAAASSPTKSPGEVKENRWKLAFRQLMFMKQMNMQVNDRNKNEIELRQQNITPLSLICSIPFFNTFGASDIQRLVDACKRVPLRPGDTLKLPPTTTFAYQRFYIVISGHLAVATDDTDNAQAIQLANLSPKFKLGIGDYFAMHRNSNGRVIAMEPVEYLQISMEVIRSIDEAVAATIEEERTDLVGESSEEESFKRWALQFTLTAQRHGQHSSDMPSQTSPSGISKCSMRNYCKDLFLLLTPENELDHTLESMKSSLLSAFNARRVRIYVVDESSQQFVIKVGSEKTQLWVNAAFHHG
ncbi:hypothetical protein PINS_up002550 [Pythium insidiosum]|nr:hypothetical protein PINS_up002550 [Pythium insidiosum]